MPIELTSEQNSAFESMMLWFRRAYKSVYTISGFSGSGKTTLISYFSSQINIPIAYVTYTGKAASVLRKKLEDKDAIRENDYIGTIHSLIYKPVEKDGIVVFYRTPYIEYDLIVVDEASMVGTEIFADLVSYNKMILFVGDSGQLPPVSDLPGVDLDNPDARLTEIHRQAEGNPIIRFSKDIREGKSIPFGCYGRNVWKLNSKIGEHKRIITELMNRYVVEEDIMLCGFNRTRVAKNRLMRERLGFKENEPVIGDKVICLRNNRMGIYNGMIGFISDLGDKVRFKIRMKDKDKNFHVIESFMDFEGTEYI